MIASLLPFFRSIGLTTLESRICFELMQWEKDLATLIDIHEETYYRIAHACSILKNKNLIWERKKDWVTFYYAYSLEHILKQLHVSYDWLDDVVSMINASTLNDWITPIIQYYEWIHGLKNYYKQLLHSKDTIYWVLWAESVHPQLKEFLDNVFVPQRVGKRIQAKVIIPLTDANQQYAWYDRWSLRETKIIDNTLFSIKAEIDLFDEDCVGIALFNREEMRAFIIRSKSLYTSVKSLFDLVWTLW
jgi:hypothetical protein